MKITDVHAFSMSDQAAVRKALDELVGSNLSTDALAVVGSTYKEHPERYRGVDRSHNLKALQQAAFDNFQHLLRVGGEPYGVRSPMLGAAADVIYLDGAARTAIHDACNAAAVAYLASISVDVPAPESGGPDQSV